MYKTKSLFYLLIIMCVGFVGYAQIQFTAKANKYVVGQNENFTIEFKINENGRNFKAPDLSDFVVLSGPNPSQYSSYSNVSGRSFSLAYNYQLRPRNRGTFIIGTASIDAAGDTYRTEPMKIAVVTQAAQPANPNDPQAVAAAGAFFRIITNKKTVYRGEPLIASYKLYTKLNVSSPQVRKEPPMSGFYKEDIDLGRITTKAERYKNENFSTGIVRQLVLIPQKTGVLKPGEVEMIIPTVVEAGGRDIFGFRRRQQINQVSIQSYPAITVKPLPENGKPSNFSGAVGDYTFSVTCSKTKLKADESITFKVEMKGSGNIKLASLPKPEFPAAFEAYDPKYKENISVSINGMRGSKSNEYLLVPRYGGKYKIPAMEFSFFNVDRGRYETIKSQPFEITVEGSAANPNAGGATISAEKEGVTFLGRDILTLKTDLELSKKSKPFFGSGLFYGVLIAGLGLLLLIIALGVYLSNRKVDYTLQRQTKASKKARKRLALAKKELDANNTDGFYEALANALWGYFGDKLNIAPSKLSKEFIGENLKQKGADEASVDRVLAMLSQAEMARYSADASLKPKEDYEEAAVLITKIDAQL